MGPLWLLIQVIKKEKQSMTKEEKKKLIEDYLSKCPFIEFHQIHEINEETATIDIAFDSEALNE